MITSKFAWKINDEKPDTGFFQLAKKEGLDSIAAQILYSRGLKQEKEVQAFLHPDLSKLYDPFLLHHMQKAVDRIRQAIERGEQILIYGDYDADGMTASSIVKEALDMLGAEVQVYLPNRFTDGYGPNQSVYKYFIEQQDVSLIITVDNGVAGHDAIAYAQAQGVDVIVTDHHGLPESLPQAFALIHPQHPEAAYPFKDLAGCGVAFKLACALLESIPTELLDLVAIGTIADMVSLTDENRILVTYGLEILKQTERLGLQELMVIAGVDFDHIDEETIGFKIAPQLNALGRLDDPNPAIELLTGFDDEEAKAIATLVNTKNEERKTLVETIFEEASAMVDQDKPIQVLAKEGWHAGVLGIVAGRIMDQIGQPVIILTIESGIAKGSARSPEVFNMFAALKEHSDLFIAFGGHSGAAGMTLQADKLDDLIQALQHYLDEQQLDLSQKNGLAIDETLHLPDLSLETIRILEKLAPFGMDNPKPVFQLKNFQVKQARTMGQNGAHLKLRVAQEGAEYDLLAFNQGHLLVEFQQAQHLELAVTLSINHWNGNTSLQLILVDARVTGVQLLDIRSKNSQVPADVPVLSKHVNGQSVVLLDIPDSEEELKALFAGHHFKVIYFKNNIKRQFYLTGYGTREQFAKLYKTIYRFPEFDVRYKLNELSRFLNIPDILLIKMIQIFDELDFVTISDGVMRVNKQAQKRDISESHIYQDLKKLVKFQELMALGTPQEIYDFLTSDQSAQD